MNWQRAKINCSGEAITETLSAGIAGLAMAAPREQREFLRLFGVWANNGLRAGLLNLAARGGFLELE